jgi:hypothetical protein
MPGSFYVWFQYSWLSEKIRHANPLVSRGDLRIRGLTGFGRDKAHRFEGVRIKHGI